MKEEKERINIVKINSARPDINIDPNSKEAVMLEEVIKKEAAIKKPEN